MSRTGLGLLRCRRLLAEPVPGRKRNRYELSSGFTRAHGIRNQGHGIAGLDRGRRPATSFDIGRRAHLDTPILDETLFADHVEVYPAVRAGPFKFRDAASQRDLAGLIKNRRRMVREGCSHY